MSYSISLIVTAAGIGKRLGSDINKTLLKIGDKTILEINLNAFLKFKEISEILISYNNDDYKAYKQIIDSIDINKENKFIKLIKGGKERHESVLNCLKKISNQSDYILIHDAARPFFTSNIFKNFCTEIKNKKEAIVPYLPSQDTILCLNSMADELYLNNHDLNKIDRNLLLNIQTPQCFSKRLASKIISIIEDTNNLYTDESTALLNTNEKVQFIKGSKFLNKITDIEDYEIACEVYQAYIKKENNI